MADKPGGYKSSHNVSRHTVVMRKARDEDMRRVAESDDDSVVHQSPNNPAASLTARGAGTQVMRRTESGRTTTSSGRVIILDDNVTSGRLSARRPGDQIDSVRLSGGDTIIRYKSGDMVIRRGTRRAKIRNQVIWAYALGYLILFGLFAYHMLTGVVTITPDQFVDRAFKKRQGDQIIDLARAAYEAMRGNRTPAEVHMAQALSFYDEEKDTVRVAAGDRLTLLTAAKLGHAIIEDQKAAPKDRTFQKPFKVYKETYLAGVNWPHLLTVYNSIGFFLLALLFLWRPLMHYLGTQGKKTAVALRNARDSRLEVIECMQKKQSLSQELEERRRNMANDIAIRAKKERDLAVSNAKKEARDISGGMYGAIANERTKQFAAIGTDAADKACDQALGILEKRLGQPEHDAAFEQLLADIRKYGEEKKSR